MLGNGHVWKQEEVWGLKLVREYVEVKGLSKEIVEMLVEKAVVGRGKEVEVVLKKINRV